MYADGAYPRGGCGLSVSISWLRGALGFWLEWNTFNHLGVVVVVVETLFYLLPGPIFFLVKIGGGFCTAVGVSYVIMLSVFCFFGLRADERHQVTCFG